MLAFSRKSDFSLCSLDFFHYQVSLMFRNLALIGFTFSSVSMFDVYIFNIMLLQKHKNDIKIL